MRFAAIHLSSSPVLVKHTEDSIPKKYTEGTRNDGRTKHGRVSAYGGKHEERPSVS
jgi:hypothetical protein